MKAYQISLEKIDCSISDIGIRKLTWKRVKWLISYILRQDTKCLNDINRDNKSAWGNPERILV